MDKERKWTSWLLIAVIVVVAGTALVVTTLASTQPQTDETMPTPTATQNALPGVLPSASPMPGAGGVGSRTANASAIGYAGPVLVRLTLDADGSIAALDVGGARFQETEGVGSRVKEEAHINSFIGKKPPLTLGETADAVAGATLSSQAMVDAINDAAAFLQELPSDMK